MFAAESSRWSIGLEPIEAVRRVLHFSLAIEIVAIAVEARLKWILAALNKRRSALRTHFLILLPDESWLHLGCTSTTTRSFD